MKAVHFREVSKVDKEKRYSSRRSRWDVVEKDTEKSCKSHSNENPQEQYASALANCNMPTLGPVA